MRSYGFMDFRKALNDRDLPRGTGDVKKRPMKYVVHVALLHGANLRRLAGGLITSGGRPGHPLALTPAPLPEGEGRRARRRHPRGRGEARREIGNLKSC